MVQERSFKKRVKKKSGKGLLNKLIDRLPVELHIPGYQFCGPGTKLAKRLQRGDQGVNALDKSCKEHDIIYSQSQDTETRKLADKALAKAALGRATAKDSGIGEKLAALSVAGIMAGKSKLGMGLKRARKKKGGVLLVAPKPTKVKRVRKRLIKAPKKGGFLPLLFPILGALGALGGGAAGIAKAVNDAKANQQRLVEQKRHNAAMESKALKGGSGVFLKYPFPKNYQ